MNCYNPLDASGGVAYLDGFSVRPLREIHCLGCQLEVLSVAAQSVCARVSNLQPIAFLALRQIARLREVRKDMGPD